MKTLRLLVLCLLLAAILTGVGLLIFTEQGRQLASNPHALGQDVHNWVARHPVIAPTVYIAAFVLIGILGLPVWWLQVLGGYGFGLLFGILWSLAGATISATATATFFRWLGGEWFHSKVEARIAKLRELDEKLGHNGFLVVMAVRLAHFLPFGLSNYAFGLIGISAINVAIGSLLGGIPSTTVYVSIGSHPHLIHDWRFLCALAVMNLILLGPLLLRYLRPQWFRKIGVE